MSTALATTENLADRINAEHRECEASAYTGLGHACEAGKLLIKAKRACKKGKQKWLPWIKVNCELSQWTASWYMRVAKNWTKLAKNRERAPDLSSRQAHKLLAAPEVKSPKPPVDEGKAAEAILRESGEEGLVALVDVGDQKARKLGLPQALEMLDRLKDGRLTRPKFAAHVKAGVPGVREALKVGPEKPKPSRAEQLGPEWVELRTLLIDARKLLAGWTRQQKSVTHLAKTHPNKGLAQKALVAVEKLTADLFVVEEGLRECLK